MEGVGEGGGMDVDPDGSEALGQGPRRTAWWEVCAFGIAVVLWAAPPAHTRRILSKL